ncbi:hypothetical protein LTR95_002752 [Oleoguttula sp. CCFEE 5521]
MRITRTSSFPVLEHLSRIKRQYTDLVVVTFGTSHQPSKLEDVHAYSRHLDEEIKRIIDGYLMSIKGLEESHITEILQGWPGINESNPGQHRSWVMDYQRDAQHKTCEILLRTMEILINTSGGIDVWREAVEADIEKLLLALFDQLPLTKLKLVFHYEDGSVDFERIWRNAFDGGK